jgi:hypothetical protein
MPSMMSRLRGAFVQAALAGVEQRVLRQRAPGGAVPGLHLVVVDLQVRRSTSLGWPPVGMPTSPAAPRPRRRPGAMRVWACTTARAAPLASARSSMVLAVCVARCEMRTWCSSTASAASSSPALCAPRLLHAKSITGALQVVAAALGQQSVFVAGTRAEAGVHVVGDAVGWHPAPRCEGAAAWRLRPA